MASNRKVILFKDPPTPCSDTVPDPYTVCLTSRMGLDVHYIPVMSTSPDPNPLIDFAREYPDGPKIIIATSARASKILAQNWPFRNSSNHSVQVWVTGKATATPLRILEQSGAVQIHGDLTGNAMGLASALIVSMKQLQNKPLEPPVIILKGDKTLNIIPNQLLQAKISFIELQVYATSFVLDSLTLSAIISDPNVEWWVFFSPSGVDAVMQLGKPPTRIKVGAIGTTTSEYLHSLRWTVNAIASVPSPEGLVEAMLKSLK